MHRFTTVPIESETRRSGLFSGFIRLKISFDMKNVSWHIRAKNTHTHTCPSYMGWRALVFVLGLIFIHSIHIVCFCRKKNRNLCILMTLLYSNSHYRKWREKKKTNPYFALTHAWITIRMLNCVKTKHNRHMYLCIYTSFYLVWPEKARIVIVFTTLSNWTHSRYRAPFICCYCC